MTQSNQTTSESATNKGPIIVVINDMLFESKIRAAGRAVGVEPEFLHPCADVAAELKRSLPALLIVDLNNETEQALAAVATGRRLAASLRIMGFVSHVDQETAKRALAAGADEVLPRSRFSSQLEQILRHGKAPSSPVEKESG